MTADIRRADRRFHTNIDWLDSRHSFSFGPHYDPANTHFGVLMVSNDDVVKAGTGFETHPHRDMEIVTWVLAGSLVHQDSTGHSGVIHPGLAQRMSAGTGILHSEKNDAHGAPSKTCTSCRCGWCPTPRRSRPGTSSWTSDPAWRPASWSWWRPGCHGTSTRARSRSTKSTPRSTPRGSTPGAATASPVAPLAHLFVARGSVELEGAGVLGTGDAARITGADGQRVTAGPDGAEVLIWEMHATLS